MKKLKLKSNAFQGNALSREQLKKVLGGVANDNTSQNLCANGVDLCTQDNDCPENLICFPHACVFGPKAIVNACMRSVLLP